MGTRGVFGFHKNNVDKITYNHYDSYPSGLGNDVKKFISNHTMSDLNKIFKRIIMVTNEIPPTPEQIEECKKYCNLDVSEQSTSDWYCLTRDAQGNPEAYAKDLKYMIDDHKFIEDSLMCEWGYIINLDSERLEIYVGFQKKPNDNRYHIDKPDDFGYYNCALVREIPLSQVKNFNMETFEREIGGEE